VDSVILLQLLHVPKDVVLLALGVSGSILERFGVFTVQYQVLLKRKPVTRLVDVAVVALGT